MWFLLAAIAVGALIFKSQRSGGHTPASRMLPPGASAPAARRLPTPMDVLVHCIQTGQQPPPLVISCAIAQVEQMNRPDLREHIIRLYVQPTVMRHMQAQQQSGHAASPQTATDSAPPSGSAPPASGQPSQGLSATMTDEQIQEILNADPTNFASRIQRGDVIDIQPGPERTDASAAAPPSDTTVSGTVIGVAVSEPPMPPMSSVAASHPTSTRMLGSPIRSVDSELWETFCDRIARESPAFQSSKHIGQYRQRRERLAELGIDPRSIIGSPEAQRHALDRDLADAHYHATEGGMVDEHVERTITIPGQDRPVQITRSGLLGVIQAAGLDGAVSWLESYHDRKRFPHTTQAFLRSNGVF